MPVFDRIKFDGTANNENWIVYKMQPENIVLGSQLIVGVGQEAIFIKGGKAQDLFTPGTYTLESGNLPLLRGLVELPFGGKTPFAAEVVYINRTSNLGLKWGTSSPINVEDPKYGILLGLRAFGQWGVKVDDSRLFLNRLIGTIHLDSGFNHNLIMQQFNSIINTKVKSIIMSFMSQKRISFLDVAAYYEEISHLILDSLKKDFEGFGLEIVNFLVESISPPKGEYDKLRQYKEELALGEGFYGKRRTFDVLEGLAQSSAGDMVAAAVGIGAGLSVVPAGAGVVGQLSQNVNANMVSASNSSGVVCPACGQTVETGSRFCRFCGQPLPQQKFCSGCGTQLEVDAQFCSRCGRRCE